MLWKYCAIHFYGKTFATILYTNIITFYYMPLSLQMVERFSQKDPNVFHNFANRFIGQYKIKLN